MARSPQGGSRRQPVSDVLDRANDPSLSGLLKHARSLLAVESLLVEGLGLGDDAMFQVAAVRKNRLILISPSAALATRLKLMSPRMLEVLRNHRINSIEHVDVRVAPLTREIQAERQRKPLSPAARKALDTLSKTLSEKEPDPLKGPESGTDGG